MPTARTGLASAVVNGKIYAIGGIDDASSAIGFRLATVEEYDPLANTWATRASMPTARFLLGAAAVNGKIYAIGGSPSLGPPVIATVEEYDTAANTWTTKASMPTARAHVAVAAVNGKVYAIGGTNGSNLNTVEEFDPATNAWTTKASMSTGRNSPGIVVVNGKIYVMGGSTNTYLATMEEYDPATNIWTPKASMPAARNGIGAAAVDGKIYAIGGQSFSGFFATVEEYDPATNIWTTKAFMPTARGLLTAEAVNGKIYAIGGQNLGTNQLDTVEEFEPSSPPTPPLAGAGADQTVAEGELVALDGSASSADGGDPLSYSWSQVAGPAVALLDAATVTPSFYAPAVLIGGATLTFELIVNDGFGDSAPDTVDISVKNVNNPPIAFAGDDQTVVEDALVMLDGSGSADVDNDPLSFLWMQVAGTPVLLVDADTANPGFLAPFVGQLGELLSFQLLVSDGIDSNFAYVDVLVENVNHPPIANAGGDQTRAEGSEIVLDGSASYDPDLDPISFSWIQVGGPTVALAGAGSVAPRFTPPQVTLAGATLVFELGVSDFLDPSLLPDTVSIQVLDVNAAPLCAAAVASQPLLWPPNHKLIPITIMGVSDPENDAIVITVTSVTQDEPATGLGQGDTGPDAVLQGSTVLIRAERSGTGNGRVYRIHFTATDGQGGSCQGSVTVSVPQSQGKNGGAVDSGQNYNSN